MNFKIKKEEEHKSNLMNLQCERKTEREREREPGKLFQTLFFSWWNMTTLNTIEFD